MVTLALLTNSYVASLGTTARFHHSPADQKPLADVPSHARDPGGLALDQAGRWQPGARRINMYFKYIFKIAARLSRRAMAPTS